MGDGFDLIGPGALIGLIGHGVTDFHVFECVEVGVAPAIMAEQRDITRPAAAGGIVAGAFGHGTCGSAFIHLDTQTDPLDRDGPDTAIGLREVSNSHRGLILDLDRAPGSGNDRIAVIDIGILRLTPAPAGPPGLESILGAGREVGILERTS